MKPRLAGVSEAGVGTPGRPHARHSPLVQGAYWSQTGKGRYRAFKVLLS